MSVVHPGTQVRELLFQLQERKFVSIIESPVRETGKKGSRNRLTAAARQATQAIVVA